MRLRLVFVVCLVAGLSMPHLAKADSSTPLVELSELLPDPAAPLTDAHDEFTEVHSLAPISVNLAGYQIKIGTHTYTFGNVTLDPDAYVTVTSGNSNLSLANAGATVTLVGPDAAILDTATYGTAKTGWSWAKLNGSWLWTDNVTAGAANLAPTTLTPSPSPTTGSATATVGAPTTPFVGPSPLLISELLPDPAAPLTDAHDEFIELFNPSDTPQDLTGYVLKAGSTLSGHFALTGTVAPGGYVVFTSATDHLQLANTGSSVALFDPSGTEVDSTVKYGAALTGQAWARFADGWAWTTTPTPGASNVLSAPAAKITAGFTGTSAAKTTAKPKTSTSKKLSTKAASTVKTAAAATTAVASAAAKGSGLWLLLVLLGLTIGFVSYEFRHDILDLYHRARGYFRRRRQASR